MIEWIQTPDWESSESFLEQHAETLLTDAAESVLQQLLEHNDNNPTIAQHQALLRRCREVGIAEAYAESGDENG